MRSDKRSECNYDSVVTRAQQKGAIAIEFRCAQAARRWPSSGAPFDLLAREKG